MLETPPPVTIAPPTDSQAVSAANPEIATPILRMMTAVATAVASTSTTYCFVKSHDHELTSLSAMWILPSTTHQYRSDFISDPRIGPATSKIGTTGPSSGAICR